MIRTPRQLAGRLSPTGMAVVALLSLHAGLLGWIGLRNSPGLDEVAHLSAGLSHWKLGRFELYRVNPPLVRMIAAVPLLFLDVNTDWSDYTDAPYTRPEFSVGNRFFELNGEKTFLYFTFARWMCIPLTKTASAQAKSAARAGLMFSSTNRTFQVFGSTAAMTSRPCGGMKARTASVSG